MSRVKHKLTAKFAESKKQPGYYSDGGNLYLRVAQSSSKSWAFYYKANGKRHELGLGSYPTVTLSEAREKAETLRKQISQGIDPLDEKRRLNEAKELKKAKLTTFKQCAGEYIKTHSPGWKNAKHLQQWQNTLSQYVYPVFGEINAQHVDTQLVLKCLDPIWLVKNETAGRVRGRIESILDFATVHKYREGENPARWKGHLDQLLAKPSKVQKKEHHSALSYSDVPSFIDSLKDYPGISAKCLEFTILTAARTGEAIGATWDEINLTDKVWTIPASRMKAANEHKVPLSKRALKLLGEMAAIRYNDFIFPSNGKKGISNMAMLTLLRRMDRPDITVHGFRSSFRDWAAEQTDYQNFIIEMALAHTIKNEAEAAYRRGVLLEKRALLMQDWADYLYTQKK